MQSTVNDYQWLEGCRHVAGVPYMLPNDGQEIDRLDLQHYMLRYTLKGNYLAPIAQPARILDVGSGTGRWVAEMAREFPPVHHCVLVDGHLARMTQLASSEGNGEVVGSAAFPPCRPRAVQAPPPHIRPIPAPTGDAYICYLSPGDIDSTVIIVDEKGSYVVSDINHYQGGIKLQMAKLSQQKTTGQYRPQPTRTQQKKRPPRRAVTRPRNKALLIGLLCLVVIGGAALIYTLVSSHIASVDAAAAKAAAQAYATGTEGGVMFGFNAQHTAFNPYERVLNISDVPQLQQDWRVTTGGEINTSPAIIGGVVYIGSGDHKLYALDASIGKIRWTAPISNVVSSSPAVANGIVFVGSYNDKLYAFDASSGKTLWTASIGGASNSSPVVVNGVVYVGSLAGTLSALNASTGKQLWTASTAAPINSSPAVANGVVYTGSNDGKLYAFNAGTGKSLWSVTTGAPINSSPAVANGVVYIGSGDHKLYALEASSGSTLWIASTGDAIESSPAVANGVVYIGSDDHKLYALDASTGSIRWTASTGDKIASSPVVANGVVYIGSDDGKLYALDASTGNVLWNASLGNAVSSSPAVANGVVYAGSDDGRLYAFH